MALVEYLTSEEAGEPLGDNLAWPLCKIVDSSAEKAEEFDADSNGYTNGHANRHANGKSSNSVTSNGKTK